jgi:hypothetical protein
MADEEQNETTEVEAVAETEEVSDTEVSDTVPEPEAEAETPEPEAASEPEPEPEPEPAAPAKRQRSLKHVPRTARRTRTKLVREKPKLRKPITRLPKPESELGRRQERRGVVVSDKGEKTIVVKVDVIKSHPKYKKVVR